MKTESDTYHAPLQEICCDFLQLKACEWQLQLLHVSTAIKNLSRAACAASVVLFVSFSPAKITLI